MMTMERVPFSRSVTLHWTILGLGVVVFVGMVLAAIGRLFRRRFGEPRREDALPGRWTLVTAAALQVVFVIAVVAIASASGGGLLNGPLTSLKIVLALPVIGTICVLGAVYFAIGQWRVGAGTRAARLRFSAATFVALLFAWSLLQWNLLGWRM
jgi:uncharacterized membrane protein YidH (DUF202 family)